MAQPPETYRIVKGRDPKRAGVYLELIDPETEDEIAEVFYSDANGQLSISIYRPEGVPVPVVERLIESAKRELTPA